MMPRKFMSGNEKRKRKQRIDTLIQSQAGSLDKFFGSKKQKESLNVVEDLENAEEREDMGNEENENLEDNTDAGAKEPNEFVDEGDHEDMDVEVQNEDMGVEIRKPIDVLNHLKLMEDCYPNVWVAYRILLTIPVTVASGERSFSKLKLIKNYLRSTMSQERLNGLSLLSIEHEMVDKIDCEDIISTFAAKTARRIIFK